MIERTHEEVAKRREHQIATPPHEEVLSELFSAQANFVWCSLRRLGVAAADADDALQEVFLVVLRRISEYEDRGLIRAWLFAICRQVANHYHRGNTRAETRRHGLMLEISDTQFEESLVRRDAERIVRSFLEQLAEPQRIVFYLADIEGMTSPEIASELGVNLNTVYGRLRLARKRFERVIAENGHGESSLGARLPRDNR